MATNTPALSRNSIAYVVAGVVVVLLLTWLFMAAGDDEVVTPEGADAEAVVTK